MGSADRLPPDRIERVEWLDHRAQYQSIKTEIDDAIQRVLLSGQYVQSDEVFGFEEEFSQYCNVLHGVGVHSGSDAIVLALKAWGIEHKRLGVRWMESNSSLWRCHRDNDRPSQSAI